MNGLVFTSATRSAQRTGPQGFTLVELMIVVVIIGVLAAVSGPTIARSIERSRLADTNRAIVNGFNEARSFAMGSGEVVFAQINATDNRIDFILPTNAGGKEPKALSCAVATMAGDPGTGGSDGSDGSSRDGGGDPEPGGGGETGEGADDDDDGGSDGAPEGTVFSVSLAGFGTDQKIQLGTGQTAVTTLCLSPSGKILSQNGQVLPSICNDGNYRIFLSTEAIGSKSCPDMDDPDERNLRQINHTYFVDLSYSGQVRVHQ